MSVVEPISELAVEEFSTCAVPCGICSATVDTTSLCQLQAVLPPQFQHMVEWCTAADGNVEALLRVAVRTEEEIHEWLRSFQEQSLLTFRVAKTFPHVGLKLLFKMIYHCQHKGRYGGAKNTSCPVQLTLTLQRTEFVRTHARQAARPSRSADKHLPHYPLSVMLRGQHSHSIKTAAALRFRDVHPTVRSKFKALFSGGYSPAAAWNLHQYDLHSEYNTDYVFMAGDLRYCPDKAWCYRLYYHLFHTAYGPSNDCLQFDVLQAFVQQLNAQLQQPAGDGQAAEDFVVCQQQSDSFIIAVCTPLMKRVHRAVKHSGELVFVDASGNMDRHNARVFLLLTHSAVGGLPLGVLILPNEQTSTLAAALQLYNSLLDETCFGGQGLQGPAVFMTDDCSAERNAMHAVYPDATLLLCVFHILQAFWRYLWDHKTAVPKDDRQQQFALLKKLVYAQSVPELKAKYAEVLQDGSAHKHPKVLAQLQQLFTRRQEWAVCCRSDLPIRGNNTNNYVESAMRVLKDDVLHRTKAFNLQQLVDFCLPPPVHWSPCA